MKKLFLIIACSASLIAASQAEAYRPSRPETNWTENDLTPSIPVINTQRSAFQKIPDVAQSKGADWNNVIGMAKEVSLREARRIAYKNPEISFFFYMKGSAMVLENENGYRHFNHGDAVFFSGTPTWGSAENFADGYIKIAD